MDQYTGIRPRPEIVELSKTTARLNLEIQERRIHRILEAV